MKSCDLLFPENYWRSNFMTMTAAKSPDQDSELLTEIHHHTGIMTINRPKALNSLNVEVICGIKQTLHDWEYNPDVRWVLMEGTGEKSFCAGGDIRSVYYAKQNHDLHIMDEIFRQEYQMNYTISQYPKPYIALIHGICMGGGLGVSVHGKYRIVCEDTVMAMPETGIGFFPDIGASYFLNKCPGNIGLFLGLLGERFHAGDALYCGLATHYVPKDKWTSLKVELHCVHRDEDIQEILQKYHQPKVSEKLAELRPLIDDIFAGDDFDGIMQRLSTSSHPIVQKWHEELAKKSPTSLKLTFHLLHRARGLSLKEALIQEYRISQACMKNHDFFEGVRALLVDKDNNPQWTPSKLDDVLPEMIDAYFSSLGDKELNLK